MHLWLEWYRCIQELRDACSRRRTFMWMVVALMGMTIRTEHAGVASFIRAGFIRGRSYTTLLHLFHSTGLKLDMLVVLWSQLAIRLFDPVVVNGHAVLAVDGIKAAREGRKMPAVKRLHQESANNSKAPFIWGHSFQVIGLLARAGAGGHVCVPLISRICEGLIFTNRDTRSIPDKMVLLFKKIAAALSRPLILVADAYYANRSVILPLLAGGHHLVTRVRINAVAWHRPPPVKKRKRGRPRKYGEKVVLRELFADITAFQEIDSPVYGEEGVSIRYHSLDLLWRPVARCVRFVLVAHPTRGTIILLSSSTDIDPVDVIRLYGLRFKIEVSFKQAIHTLGSYAYHFWMKDMKPLTRRGTGTQYLHRQSEYYRKAVRRKMDAYHRWAQLACIAQGMLQHLAVNYRGAVWTRFRSWMRTMKTDRPPSEQVVAQALRNGFPEFLLSTSHDAAVTKFILDHADPHRLPGFRMIA